TTISPEERTRADLDRATHTISLLTQHTDKEIENAVKSIRENSRDYRDHLWLGQLLGATGSQADVAEKHLREALSLEGKEAETWVALVQFLVAQKRIPEAKTLIGLAQTADIKPAQKPLAMAQIHNLLGN